MLLNEYNMTISLSSEQIRLVPFYWEKWQSIIRSTQPLNRTKATDAVIAFYRLAAVNHPEIIFVANPLHYYAQAYLRSEIISIQQDGSLEQHLRSNPENVFIRDPQQNIARILAAQLKFPVEQLFINRTKVAFQKIKQGRSRTQAFLEADEEIFTAKDKKQIELLQLIDKQFNQYYGTQVSNQMFVPVENSWIGDIYRLLYEHIDLTPELKVMIADHGLKNFNGINVGCIDCHLLAFACARFDYCISVMDFPVTDSRWQVLQSLVTECGSMLFPYEDFCIVCDRLFAP